jgi:lipopolysaccharide export system protein LptC
LLLFLLLGAAAGGSTWFAQRLQLREEATEKADAGEVDYFSIHIRRVSFGEDGQPKNQLIAPILTHYAGDDHTELKDPVLTVYSKGGPPWVITGEHGTLLKEGEVRLDGPVLIQREADREKRSVRVVTRNISVYPQRNYAETAEHVEVVSEPDYLRGDGAQVHFGEVLQVTILSNVFRKHDVQ